MNREEKLDDRTNDPATQIDYCGAFCLGKRVAVVAECRSFKAETGLSNQSAKWVLRTDSYRAKLDAFTFFAFAYSGSTWRSVGN